MISGRVIALVTFLSGVRFVRSVAERKDEKTNHHFRAKVGGLILCRP